MKAKTLEVIAWRNHALYLLDQRALPGRERVISCRGYRDVIGAIKDLTVRGAPALGVVGAYAVVLAAVEASQLKTEKLQKRFFDRAVSELTLARPTAVNLSWAIKWMCARMHDEGLSLFSHGRLLELAKSIHETDRNNNHSMARHGLTVLGSSKRILTVCNTGDLATGGFGTALGVIRECFKHGDLEQVLVCETRPVLQGLRLTAWELTRDRIPFRVICDNMVGWMMAQGLVDAVIVGADRVAANGDVVNKIGTYQVAVLAMAHGVPFYVAAPLSTFDLSLESGAKIPIEHRSGSEIIDILGVRRGKFNPPTLNPAFDMTPHGLIKKIISERGLIKPEFSSIARVRKFTETCQAGSEKFGLGSSSR